MMTRRDALRSALALPAIAAGRIVEVPQLVYTTATIIKSVPVKNSAGDVIDMHILQARIDAEWKTVRKWVI